MSVLQIQQKQFYIEYILYRHIVITVSYIKQDYYLLDSN